MEFPILIKNFKFNKGNHNFKGTKRPRDVTIDYVNTNGPVSFPDMGIMCMHSFMNEHYLYKKLNEKFLGGELFRNLINESMDNVLDGSMKLSRKDKKYQSYKNPWMDKGSYDEVEKVMKKIRDWQMEE